MDYARNSDQKCPILLLLTNLVEGIDTHNIVCSLKQQTATHLLMLNVTTTMGVIFVKTLTKTN